jgi:betainyl-CoA thioesterase
MNEAYYVLVFSHATDDFMDFVGLDMAYRKRANASIYTLETHVVYLLEVGVAAPLTVETQLLGVDRKRFHLFHAMRHSDSADLLATAELMLLHVDMSGPRSAPFPADIAARLAEIDAAHCELPRPEQAGRSIAPLSRA